MVKGRGGGGEWLERGSGFLGWGLSERVCGQGEG